MSESISPSDDRVDAEIVDAAVDVSPETVDEAAVEAAVPEPVDETVEDVIAEIVEEAAPEPVEETVPEPVEEPVAETAPEPVEEPVAEAVPEPVEEPVAEAAPEPAEEPVAETVREPIAETVPDSVPAMTVPTTGDASFGRVEDDGTVYVRTADGERRVGQVPDVSADEAMAFFTGRYDSLAAEVALLGQRVIAGSMSPDEARRSITTLKANIAEANAVGDLETLSGQLDTLTPIISVQAEQRRAQRVEAQNRAKEAKEGMVAEAEKLAGGNDWKSGVTRFHSLLDEWKMLPRIDKTTDDDLWKRFSAARTTYTRRRKTHFADVSAANVVAQAAKEAIIAEAAPLATSTDWRDTAEAFRTLMNRWKAAGSAGRQADDKLWGEFRAIQDTFFQARSAAYDEQSGEFKANEQAKEAILAEAEATIKTPVTDPQQARAQLRGFLIKYNSHGRVSRGAMHSFDSRVRALENAVREAEDAEWRRTDPQARQRAQDTVDMFTTQITKLEKQADDAEAKGDTKRSTQLRESITTYKAWREQAQAALDEFVV
ncbi:MAG: DUF349 domain-containing protein [Propionibacteriaceae bacterium]|nr:DUF349 domain-containing protein [Propionibacteriaceae bacterium]